MSVVLKLSSELSQWPGLLVNRLVWLKNRRQRFLQWQVLRPLERVIFLEAHDDYPLPFLWEVVMKGVEEAPMDMVSEQF